MLECQVESKLCRKCVKGKVCRNANYGGKHVEGKAAEVKWQK